MNKRGQVTIFIIIAIVIVAIAVLAYMFFPQLKSTFGARVRNPTDFLQTCLEDEIKSKIETISLQGGSLEPENYFLYQDQKIEYLCYTNEYYLPCVMQQPLLKQHIEAELDESIREDVVMCFDAMKQTFEDREYSVSMTRGDVSVELLPKRVVTVIDYGVTLTKESAEDYGPFRVMIHNNLYELVGITNSILNWEVTYGDAETTAYMNYYHDLKVEKKKQTDGTTLYMLTDRNSGNKFQFASRSVAWPPGYGTAE